MLTFYYFIISLLKMADEERAMSLIRLCSHRAASRGLSKAQSHRRGLETGDLQLVTVRISYAISLLYRSSDDGDDTESISEEGLFDKKAHSAAWLFQYQLRRTGYLGGAGNFGWL